MAEVKLSYVICTAPRTGSSLFCEALARMDVAGRPAEYFDIHEQNEVYWRKQLEIRDDAEYLDKVLKAGTTSNGVFGLKLHYHQAPALIAKLVADRVARGLPDKARSPHPIDTIDLSLRERLGDVRYIWLRRKNKIAQAISYYLAGKTEQWRVSAGRTAPGIGTIDFDFDAIHGLVRDVEQFDRAWYQFFMRRKLRALIVIYEDFVVEYEKTIRGALSYLGLDHSSFAVPPPQYQRQADERSMDWERRYAEQLRRVVATPRYRPRTAKRPKKAVTAKRETLPLIAYDLGSGIDMAIEPGPPARPWMDNSPKRFAYRCLPLVIANQSGWWIKNPHRLTVSWDGTPGVDGLRVVLDDPSVRPYAVSHFGLGILTFNIGCLFQTPPGYNMYVRGPTNWPKDGIAALDGVVETDWSRATFTMNWKMTRPDHLVTFERDEPIAMIVPVARGETERFRPEIRPIDEEPGLQAEYEAWSRSRSSFNAALKAGDPEALAAGWQRHYVLGMTAGEAEAPEHQTALSLAPFVDKRPPET